MVTKEELFGTTKVPSELPLPAFIAAREQGCGVLYCQRCGSVLLLPPENIGACLAIMQVNHEENGEEWKDDDVDFDRVYFTRPGCDECEEEEPSYKTWSFAHVSLPGDTEA